MAIQGLGSPFIQGINGVSGLPRIDEERRQSRNTSGNDDALDHRTAFDAYGDAMLGIGKPAASRASQATPPAQNPRDLHAADRFTHEQDDILVTYNASGRLRGQPAQAAPAQTASVVAKGSTLSTGATLASEPAAVPQAVPAGKTADKAGAKLQGELSAEEQKQIEQLRQRDQEVRAHEQAHQATGGEHAGGVSYTYQRGPDNRQYAIGGSVPIDVSPVADDPEATIAKAEKVRAAAMAPASPSGADQQVAAKAAQMASQARAEQAEKALNPEEDDNSLGAGLSKKARKSDKDGTATGIKQAEKAAEAGLTSLHAASSTGIQSDKADKIGELNTTATPGASGLVGTASLLQIQTPPRPAEAAQQTRTAQGDAGNDIASGAWPSIQATRAAFAALQQMGQLSADSAVQMTATANPSSGNPELARRAMSKATAVYTRVRGETGLAPLNTGISVAV